MPKIELITKTGYKEKYWRSPDNFLHAVKDTLAPLVVNEVWKAAVSLPVAFMRKDNALMPVVVQGVPPGENLLVSPDGKWQYGYIPAIYRGYPFSLVQGKEGKQALCIDEESGLISDTEGERFFDEKGEVSAPVKEVLIFLRHVHQSRLLTEQICGLLKEQELIEPWTIILETPEGEKKIKGLFRINEHKLNKLEDAEFLTLRKNGALPLIYCQLLSMRNMTAVIKLAGMRQSRNESSAEELPNIENMFGEDNDMFSFDIT